MPLGVRSTDSLECTIVASQAAYAGADPSSAARHNQLKVIRALGRRTAHCNFSLSGNASIGGKLAY